MSDDDIVRRRPIRFGGSVWIRFRRVVAGLFF